MQYIAGACLAFLISLGLFYGMHFLISPNVDVINSADNVKLENFIRVKHEKPAEIKKRVIPKEPKPPEVPPRPAISTAKTQTQQHVLTIDMPVFDLNLDLAGDALGGVAVAQNFAGPGSGIAVNLMPIFKVPPRYPNRAKMLKKEGFVELVFTITKEGLVEDITVLQSEPPQMFDMSAIRALEKWRFKPKIVDGKAVAQRARQVIGYTLK